MRHARDDKWEKNTEPRRVQKRWCRNILGVKQKYFFNGIKIYSLDKNSYTKRMHPPVHAHLKISKAQTKRSHCQRVVKMDPNASGYATQQRVHRPVHDQRDAQQTVPKSLTVALPRTKTEEKAGQRCDHDELGKGEVRRAGD